MRLNPSFFNGRRVFLTGHTGFKGSWMCFILSKLGAAVTGYALEPPTKPSLFEAARIDRFVNSITGDIRDKEKLQEAFAAAHPELVIHMAAQPIVRDGYKQPAYTYETNVMGTVNILECVRLLPGVRSFVNVTTDKVYRNLESGQAYREDDVLDGYDPYSNSKSCSELVTAAYRRSFFTDRAVSISTARAGNVLGGGDFAPDRIIPDCFRAAADHKDVVIRNPESIRPYQHVLEPLTAYLAILEKQYGDGSFAGSYNIGPYDQDCITTQQLVELFCGEWGDGFSYRTDIDPNAPHEASFLKLDNSRVIEKIGWRPAWDIKTAVTKTVEWYKGYLTGADLDQIMDQQIDEYLKGSPLHAK